MIEIQNEEHFAKVMQFAKETGKVASLQKNLDYLDSYAEHGERGKTKCVLGYDWAPMSFSFTMMIKNKGGEYRPWFSGGLIFHGSHDGGGNGSAPTFSVSLNPTDGWSIHT